MAGVLIQVDIRTVAGIVGAIPVMTAVGAAIRTGAFRSGRVWDSIPHHIITRIAPTRALITTTRIRAITITLHRLRFIRDRITPTRATVTIIRGTARTMTVGITMAGEEGKKVFSCTSEA